MARKILLAVILVAVGLHVAWYAKSAAMKNRSLPDAATVSEYQTGFLERLDLAIDPRSVETASLEANGFRLNLTVLPAEPGAPILVFVPGTSVYAWFYIEFLREMNRQGFHVVGFDPRGHGLSSGPRGDYTIDEEVDDTLAVARYARERFGGRVALAGSSQGGIVAFYAAARDGSLAAAVCHNLADLDGRDNLALSQVGLPAALASPAEAVLGLYRSFAIPISLYLDLKAERMKDGTDALGFCRDDPLVIRWITLKAMRSLLRTDLARPVEQISVPVMLVHSDGDNIFPQSYVEGIFNRLTCRKKYLLLKDREHLVFTNNVGEVAPQIAAWLRETM